MRPDLHCIYLPRPRLLGPLVLLLAVRFTPAVGREAGEGSTLPHASHSFLKRSSIASKSQLVIDPNAGCLPSFSWVIRGLEMPGDVRVSYCANLRQGKLTESEASQQSVI